jgi:hypothetical protein
MRLSMKHVLLLSLFFLISCGARGPLVFEVPEEERMGTFRNLSSNILESKCVGCHKNFSIEENMLKYIDGNNPDTSKLFEVVKDGSMPKKAAPLNTLELEMVRAYIQNVEVIRNVTFAELKKEILEPKCLGCHKRAGDEAVLIERWVDKKSPFASKLFISTKNGSMPKKADHLTVEEMKFIKGYLRTF